MPMGSTRKSWGPCPRTFAIPQRLTPSFCSQKASIRPRQAGPWSAALCSSKSARRSPKARSCPRRPIKLAMKPPYAGQRESIRFSFVPTSTRVTFTITFITTPRPLTAPESSITLSAPPLPCGGFLTGCVSSTIFPIFKIRRSTARGGFCIMVNGSGKGPHPINSVCALP